MSVDMVINLAVSLLDVELSAGTRAALTDFVTRTRAGAHGWSEPHLLTLTLLAPEFHVS